jgi:heme/copper-type cytochrome/quinol oxidase subunit 2
VIWLTGGGSLLLLVLLAVGIYDLIGHRDTMDTRQVVLWLIVVVVLPVVGLVVYLLWRLARSDAMVDAMDYQDEHPVDPMDRPGLSRG